MTWHELPAKLKSYIIFLSVFALPIIAYCAWDLCHKSYPIGWIVLTILTVITIPFYQLLPSVNTIVGIGDAYVMSIAMMYGSAPCVVATICHTIAASVFRPNRKIYAYRVIFNIASTVCCAWIYSSVYRLMNPGLSKSGPDIVLPVVALTIIFFFFNSFSMATAISLASGQKIFDFWIHNYLSLGVEFSISSVSAALIVTLSEIKWWWAIAAAPLIGFVWGWNKLNKAKAMEAEKHLLEQERLYLRTVESLALAVDAKDQTTYGHIRRVRAYALGLAKLCRVSDADELKAIETGSLLHDIGKLAIDDYILNKPGRLSKQEFEKMKLHASAGDEILQQVHFPFPVAQYVRCHHERWDGLGYPDGLKGEEIPLGARILSIADAFDTIRCSRPYKLSFGIQDSLEILRAQRGTLYDPHLVDLFIGHVDELVAAADEAGKNAPELSFRKYFEKVDRAISTANLSTSSVSAASETSAEFLELFEFCSSFGRHLDLPDFLHILARRLNDFLPYATCAIYLDNGEDSLKAAHVCGKHSELLQNMTIGIGKGISGWSAAYRQPMINTSPALDFQERGGDFSSLTDTLVVPLVTDGECIGTISLYAEAPIIFTAGHLASLQNLANIVTPSLAESRSHKLAPEGKGTIDPVTETHRVTHLSVAGPQLIAIAEKSQSPLSLLCIDIRNLPQLVNLYGAHTGDAILRKVADTLKAELRETDILVRFGHQGFTALLPGVRKEKAIRCAQRLHRQIKTGAVSSIAGHNILIDCQAGAASYPADGSSTFALLQSAQRAMLDQAHLADLGAEEPGDNIIEFPPRA